MRAGSRQTMVRIAGALALIALTPGSHAIEVDFSGFASVIAGRTFGDCQSGSMAPHYDGECTRYIADWGHAGVYTQDWDVNPESRVGLQWTAKFTPSVSGTAQVTGRLNRAQKAALEWAYLSYSGVADWTFQVGRKRLPLYYYSDFQDIGYAYNTIRPAPDVYGWDVVNYNGASARYQTRLGEWAVRQDFFVGGESSKNNPYYKLIQDNKQTVDWKNIVGASLELNYDWFTTRLTYVQSKYQQTDEASGMAVVQPSGATSGRQKFYGIAVNADLDDWILRSEYAIADRSDYAYKARFYLMNAGYRLGQFIPTVGFSRYAESTPFPATYNTIKNHTTTLALRYELTNKSDLKIQYDRMTETSAAPFMGSAKVIAISYDVVF